MSIASEISRLDKAKQDIKSAIESKGGSVSDSARLSDYPSIIKGLATDSRSSLMAYGPYKDAYRNVSLTLADTELTISIPDGVKSLGGFNGTCIKGIDGLEKIRILKDNALSGQTAVQHTFTYDKPVAVNTRSLYNCSGVGGDLHEAARPNGGVYDDSQYALYGTSIDTIYSDRQNAGLYFAYNTARLREISMKHLTTVGNYAFGIYGMTPADRLVAYFGPDVQTIGSYIFANRNNVELHIKAVTPPTLSGWFSNTGTLTVYVPAGSVDAYKAATNWKTMEIIGEADTSGTVTFEDSAVASILGSKTSDQLNAMSSPADLFSGNTSIKAFNEYSHFGRMNPFSFKGCTALREITLPKNAYKIPSFSGCTSLERVRGADNGQTFDQRDGTWANIFAGCENLREIDTFKSFRPRHNVIDGSLGLMSTKRKLSHDFYIRCSTRYYNDMGGMYLPCRNAFRGLKCDNVHVYEEDCFDEVSYLFGTYAETEIENFHMYSNGYRVPSATMYYAGGQQKVANIYFHYQKSGMNSMTELTRILASTLDGIFMSLQSEYVSQVYFRSDLMIHLPMEIQKDFNAYITSNAWQYERVLNERGRIIYEDGLMFDNIQDCNPDL